MSKRFIFSSVILLVLFICALFAPYLSSFDPQQVEISNKLMAPDAVHLLGTDQLGRDVLSRLLHGARYSLFLSLTISLLEVVIGVTVGLLIGWYQGKAEATFLWFANVISAFPSFLLSLATVGILGQGMTNMILAIVIIEWVYYARVTANLVKSAKEEAYVRQSKILLPQAERKLLQQRNDGYFGEYAGWPAVLQSAAENVPHVTQKRRYPHAQ